MSQTLETAVEHSMSSTSTVRSSGQQGLRTRIPVTVGWARAADPGGGLTSPAEPDSSPDSAGLSRRSSRGLGQQDRALALKLDVLSGPARDGTYFADACATEVCRS